VPAVQDKDKLRKEAAAKVKEARTAMMALTESQLDTVSRGGGQAQAAGMCERGESAKKSGDGVVLFIWKFEVRLMHGCRAEADTEPNSLAAWQITQLKITLKITLCVTHA
jgi:hypothetical protein